MADLLFISWLQHCRRNDALAANLGGKSFHVSYCRDRRGQMPVAPFKYLLQSAKTFQILFKERPRTVFVSAPPIFLAFVTYVYTLVTRARFIIDSHTGALDGAWRPLAFLHKFLSKRALTTIVTNEHLRKIILRWGAHVSILGDIVMEFPRMQAQPLSDKFNLVYISTYSGDEPLETVLRTVSELPQVHLFVTGKLKHDRKGLHKKYSLANVTYTDFLPDREYLKLLKSADAVMVLTTMNHTMQRGAYEAVSMSKPLITSNWPILRETFYKGAIYVSDEEGSIRHGILDMIAKNEGLALEMAQMKKERSKIYKRRVCALQDLIS
jgi:glycosyltransferase involved in cell wall biosynthesis